MHRVIQKTIFLGSLVSSVLWTSGLILEPSFGDRTATLLAWCSALIVGLFSAAWLKNQDNEIFNSVQGIKTYIRLAFAMVLAYFITIPVGLAIGLGYLFIVHGNIPEIKGEVSILLWLSALWFPLWWSPAIGLKSIWYLNQEKVLTKPCS